ncbi:MAG: DUF2147 domain-containing protein [Pseudomonadota bacterium]
MLTRKRVLFLLLTFSSVALASPVGTWTSIDDKTNKPKSLVEITESDGVISGKIIALIDPSEPNPLCTKCPDEKKDQPMIGLTIIWDATKQNDAWRGKILDPKKGKTYKLKLTPSADGNTLKVRGYIGNPVLGRTQTWYKELPAQ